jgi:uncharacterized protein
MKLRIPGWAQNEAIPGGLYRFIDQNADSVTIKVNGVKISSVKTDEGYAVISRKWQAGDIMAISIPMPVRKVAADERVAADKGKIAVQRGPLIFCAEWPDNKAGNVLNLVVNPDTTFTTEFIPSMLGGTQVVRTKGMQSKRTLDGKVELFGESPVTLIPYALWNNRGPGQMMVWLPVTGESAKPLPAPTISYRSKVRTSKPTRDLHALNDQSEPANSKDRSVPYYHWWPNRNQWEWIQYDFDRTQRISTTKVYWFDDGPDGGCRIPDEWEMLYLNENIWQPVKNWTRYTVSKDGWNSISFQPVWTRSVKIKVKLNKEYSAGIYEWVVE